MNRKTLKVIKMDIQTNQLVEIKKTLIEKQTYCKIKFSFNRKKGCILQNRQIEINRR